MLGSIPSPFAYSIFWFNFSLVSSCPLYSLSLHIHESIKQMFGPDRSWILFSDQIIKIIMVEWIFYLSKLHAQPFNADPVWWFTHSTTRLLSDRSQPFKEFFWQLRCTFESASQLNPIIFLYFTVSFYDPPCHSDWFDDKKGHPSKV